MKSFNITIPKLRFSEFDSKWNKISLKDATSFLKDGTHGSHVDTENSGYYLLSAKNVKNGIVIFDKFDRQISREVYNSISKSYKLKQGDLLLSIVGTIGNIARYNNNLEKVVFQRSVAFLRPKGLDPNFTFYVLQSNNPQNQMKSRTVISAQPGLYLGDIAKIKIFYPIISEQRKIADFLTVVDKKIAGIEKKVELLKKYKKGVMHKIFTQQVRFRDKNGNNYSDWENKKLGDIATIKTGNLNVQDAVGNGKYAFFDRSVEIKKFNEYSFNNEALIYAGEGSEFLPRYFNGKYGLHQRAYAIFDVINVSVKFLYYFMLTQNKHFLRMAVGSTVKSLRMDCFEMCVINLPNNKEQDKITNFLTTLDDKINLSIKELNQAKQLKKALLQRMFI